MQLSCVELYATEDLEVGRVDAKIRQNILIFRGERAPKKRNVLVKIALKEQKKTPFLACLFFRNLPASQKI